MLLSFLGYYYRDPYVFLRKSENYYLDYDKSFDVPSSMSINGQSRLSSLAQSIPEKEFYIDDDGSITLQKTPINIVAEESIMGN